MLVTALLVGCLLQCPDPPTPPEGFAFSEQFDLPVTFSDGQSTLADARAPLAAPGTCGWPLVVFIHGLFGSKASVARFGRDFASWGYITVTFDVRGHASSTGYHTYFGLRERLDVAEIIAWAQSTFAGSIDPERIALAGGSQGGILSWDGAAWSGQPFEPNPWISGTYPQVDAIVTDNLTANFASSFAPQSAAVHCAGAAALLGSGSVRFDPALQVEAAGMLAAEDYASWSALVSDPQRDPNGQLGSMSVPTMVMTAWDDFWFPPSSILATLQALPSTTPRKIYLGTGGHSTPTNQSERMFRDAWRRSWLDHFVKAVDNGIDSGPTLTYAITPSDANEYLANGSHWTHATADTWPPAGTRDYRLFLHDFASLSPFMPNAYESFESLCQTAEPSYGLSQMATDEFRLGLLEPNIPRVTLDYDTLPLESAIAYAGNARVHLSLKCPTNRYQVSASIWDVDPTGEARYVSSGGYFVFDDAPAGANEFDVELCPNAYVFAAGHRIRVQLCNLQLHQPPVGEALRYAPYPHDFELEIDHRLGALSWLDLPVDQALPIVYGLAQTNSLGCTPSLATTGSPSISSALPFAIEAHDVLSNKDGLLIYGFAHSHKPFNGGYLFVATPLHRTGVQHSGGVPGIDDCSGVFSFDFNALTLSGVDPALVSGTRIFAQYWSRDPASAATTNLTSAVEFSICD